MHWIRAFGLAAVLLPAALAAEIADLAVSQNRRYLVYKESGQPFFYLGDTAWELFHRLNREEAERYLENRRAKGFTVIQAVVLAELDGLNTPNSYGHKPLVNNDPTRPNEDYFQHVDFIIDSAGKKGLYLGVLPTWGDKVHSRPANTNLIFNPANARAYGRFLGARYRNRANIIWVLGGDRPVGSGEIEVWRAMAEGLAEGDGGRHLRTFHPGGRRSSADPMHNEAWLDFNMIQSGHNLKDNPNYEFVAYDYNRLPTKPTFDGEPRYENHPVDWNPDRKGWFNDYDVRQAFYWGVFAGALGHTYGCHDIWQMAAPGRQPVGLARGYWYDVLDLPGAFQMGHGRRLMESRPMLSRVPDQSVLVGRTGFGYDAVRAIRGGDHLMVYASSGDEFRVQMGRISGAQAKAWWYDPRTGEATALGVFDNRGVRDFDPPGGQGRGNDWVLVLDDAEKNYPPPGGSR